MSRKTTTPHLQVELLEDRLVPAVFNSALLDSGLVLQPQQPTVPALSSNPGASAKLYLDFDGHTSATGREVTPAFSTDSDRTTLSAGELNVIRDIHARVSEDFAPFNIDVTTVDPGDFSDGHALRAAIGGSWRDWYGVKPVGGLGPVNAFTNSAENLVWVFADDIFGSKDIADTVSHESGHGFGLHHQSAYDANGNLLQEYSDNNGSRLTAPIMGSHFSATFTRWWYGTAHVWGQPGSVFILQDDMAVLAGTTNGFGYRADDHAATLATATWLDSTGGVNTTGGFLASSTTAINGGTIRASGIIGRNGDTDMFAFWSGSGTATFTLKYPPGANLDAKLEFRNSNGKLLSMTTNGATVSGILPKGVIFMTVRSSDNSYGNVGQYSVEGVLSSTAGYTTTGPRVVYASTGVETYNSEVVITLAFDKPMAVATLTRANFTIIAPSGAIYKPISVTVISGKHGGRYIQLRVPLPEIGTHQLRVDGVTDVFGNRLDQNGDGIKGDSFIVSLIRRWKYSDPTTGL